MLYEFIIIIVIVLFILTVMCCGECYSDDPVIIEEKTESPIHHEI
jgi:hypothetical protein